LAGLVPLKIAYVLTCRILGLVVLMFRGGRAKDAEPLVLRISTTAADASPAALPTAPGIITSPLGPMMPASSRGTVT
jgi:hypothetical protein